ncbi:hypothetical protein KGM_212476B, partial [Danaus plexippus plexippus]
HKKSLSIFKCLINLIFFIIYTYFI